VARECVRGVMALSDSHEVDGELYQAGGDGGSKRVSSVVNDSALMCVPYSVNVMGEVERDDATASARKFRGPWPVPGTVTKQVPRAHDVAVYAP
jgi:hypothetical protein